MADALYLAELAYYDPATGPGTLRYASDTGHITGPSETPASTIYEARLVQSFAVKRDIFDSGTTSGRSRVGYGDLVLQNADGALDALLGYGVSGRAVTIRRGTPGAAYPGGFTTLFVGTMDQIEADGDYLRVKLRDNQADLDQPYQPAKYAGNNVLPDGLEGVAGDLKGKPKPRCLGSVLNVPAPCVNTSKLIYQVNDGTIASLSAVYDAGVALSAGSRWSGLTTMAFGSSAIYAMTYGGGVWVAAGQGGKLMTSTDLATWTSRDSSFGTSDITGLTYGGGLFVAVGGTGGVAGKVATSSDGVTWTQRTTPLGTIIPYAVAYSSTLTRYLVVGQSGTIITSTNGTTWITQSSGITSTLYTLVVGPDLVVAAGTGGNILTSPDAVAWTVRTSNLDVSLFTASAYGNGVYVVGGTDGTGAAGFLAVSEDAVTWTRAIVSSFSTDGPLSLAYGGQFVAGTGGGRLVTSTDGETWVVNGGGTAAFGTTPVYALATTGSQVAAGGFGGILATPSSAVYTSTVDLVDDAKAPPAGSYIACPSAGLFRLGSPPAGRITADVVQGAAAANRTAGQLFATVLQGAGKVAGDWSAADVTALDTATASAPLGHWTMEETTRAAVLDEIANSVGAWWGVDRTGVYRIKQLTAPSGTAAASFTANDMLRPIARVPIRDESRGIPAWRTTIRYARNYAVQTDGLAGSVSDDRRARLAVEWLEATSEDPSVRIAHLLAPQTVEDTLLTAVADASAEAARRQVLRGTLRHRYELVVPWTSDTETLDLGDVVSVTHSRYGMAGGVLLRIIGVDPDARTGRLTLQLWGASDPASLMRVTLAMSGTGAVVWPGRGGLYAMPSMSGTGTVGGVATGSLSLLPSMSGTGTMSPTGFTGSGGLIVAPPTLSPTGSIVVGTATSLSTALYDRYTSGGKDWHVCTISWLAGEDASGATTQIWEGSTSTFSAATQIGSVSILTTGYQRTLEELDQTRYYWVRHELPNGLVGTETGPVSYTYTFV